MDDKNNAPIINENRETVKVNNTIRQLLDQKCKHTTYYYGRYNDIDFVCCRVMDLMCSVFHIKEYIDDDLINKFWEKYILEHCYLIGYYHHQNHKSKTLKFIEQLCLYRKPSTSVLKRLIKSKQLDRLYSYIVLGENFTKFDENDVQTFCSRLNYDSDGNDDIGNIIINNVEETPQILTNLVLAKSKIIADWLYDKFIELKLVNKNNIHLPDIQNNICSNIDYHHKLFKYLLEKGIEFTKDHIILVCSHGNIESINLVYQSTRFEVTREHFNAICLSSKEIFDSYMRLVIKIIYTPDKAELMFKYGYKLDIEDVKFIICNKVQINDIDRFGLELGEEILTLCGKYDFYPTYNFKNSDPGLVELYKLTRIKNVTKLREFYKTHKTVPDAICMDNVCSIHNNTASYNILRKHGGELIYENIETASISGGNSFIRTIISDYKEVVNDKDKQIKKLKNEINDLKKELNSLQNDKKSNIKIPRGLKSNEKLQQMIDTIQKDNEMFRIQQKQLEVLMNSNINLNNRRNVDNETKIYNQIKINEKSREESNKEESNKEEFNKEESNKEHKNNLKQKSKSNSNYQKECNKAITFNISDETILKTKEKYRYLSDAPLSIDNIDLKLNDKMSYSDLKIHIINHFRDKKWIHENVIKIPLDARLLLNIIDGNYINIGDIDKFVTYLYNFEND